MRIVIIGATGHIGTSLVPRLVGDGHKVVAVSRGGRAPYRDPGIWRFGEKVTLDREKEEAAGSFGERIASLEPDAVIDLICFTRRSAEHLAGSLRGRIGHYLCCGTIWVHGHSEIVPTTEDMPRKPFGEYGVNKAEMEAWLLETAHRDGFPATLIHPGHIVGPGWAPLNPAGHFNPDTWKLIAEGGKLTLPNLGMETVHHVHADDVAQIFCAALSHRSVAAGESFHAVSPAAMTLRGYAERMFQWFGHEPDLAYLPWDQWKSTVAADDAAAAWDHIAHSPCCSIEKAVRLLGYRPRYSSLQGVCESVEWLARHEWRAA
jgi:nucleoside-diphosphate-sugar epimerase